MSLALSVARSRMPVGPLRPTRFPHTATGSLLEQVKTEWWRLCLLRVGLLPETPARGRFWGTSEVWMTCPVDCTTQEVAHVMVK